MLFCLVMLLCLCATASAEDADKWTRGDTVLQAAVLSFTAIDASQTLKIARNPDKYYESGFACTFIGEHPSVHSVKQYFIVSAIVKTGVAVLLPKPYRTVWQAANIGISLSYIHKNMEIGLRLSF